MLPYFRSLHFGLVHLPIARASRAGREWLETPEVCQNLTNFTGIINDKGLPANENITYHAGSLERDLEMLSDKVSGYYTVLHEMSIGCSYLG